MAEASGAHCGSLSGGCVEEDFLSRLRDGFFEERISTVRYGAADEPGGPSVRLPCGGVLDVLVEKLPPGTDTEEHLGCLLKALSGQGSIARKVSTRDGSLSVVDDDGLGPAVEELTAQQQLVQRVGPVARLIIAGVSTVSIECARVASLLGFEVVVCDPRPEEMESFPVAGISLVPLLPSLYIERESCHSGTAVVALTHDPRIDDLALIEAVRTDAFYIGVMGSIRTSQIRAERLLRSGGLSQADIDRIHMPIGLALGSKTPAEIALAVMADIVRVRRGRARDQL